MPQPTDTAERRLSDSAPNSSEAEMRAAIENIAKAASSTAETTAGTTAASTTSIDHPAADTTLDPRVVRTRRLLEDALVSLMHERPYAHITVKDIAATATVNRATFYAHFVDKDDLFKSFLRNSFRRVLTERTTSFPDTTDAYLDSLIPAVFEYVERLNGARQTTTCDSSIPPPDAELQSQLEEFVLCWASHIRDPNQRLAIPADVLSVAISATITRVALHWSKKFERPPLEVAVAQLRALVRHALEAALETAPKQ